MYTREDAVKAMKSGGSVLPKITNYRGQFLTKYPWFASLVMRLEVVESEEHATAATDGVHLFFNKAFLDQQTSDQAFGLFAHECGHCVLGHCDPDRRGKRDPRLWNIAADYVVNAMLLAEGFVLPNGALYDERFADWSTEQVYAELANCPKHQALAKQMTLDVLTFPDGTAGERAQLREDWAKAGIQAAEARAAVGDQPGGLTERVRTDLAPVADYRAVLAEYVSQCCSDDATWAVPNRRYLPHGTYMPSSISDGVQHLVIGIDCSGSVSTEMLSQFVSQIAPVLAAYPIERLDVYVVDTIVQAKHEFVEVEDLARIASVTGRGGTDFECVFDDLKAQPAPDLVMFFTDFDCAMPASSRDASYPILWMVPEQCVPYTKHNYDPRCGILVTVK